MSERQTITFIVYRKRWDFGLNRFQLILELISVQLFIIFVRVFFRRKSIVHYFVSLSHNAKGRKRRRITEQVFHASNRDFSKRKKNVFIHVVGRKCQFTFFHSIMKRVSGEKNITRGNHYNLLDSLRAAKRSAVQKLLHLLIKISPWKKRHCRGRKISMNDTVDGRNGSLGVKCNAQNIFKI